MKKIKLSVVIISKNEEKIIGRCLDSVRWADELVVVDSGSIDNTINICKRYNARIYYKKWQGYSKQKNFAISKAKGNWILSVDADEVVSDELRDEIKKALENDKGEHDAYEIKFKNYFYGKFLRFGGMYPDYHLRLFRKGKGRFNSKQIHEGIWSKGKKARLAGDILHFTCETISNHVENINKYTEIEALQNINVLRSPTGYSIYLKPVYNFIKNYFFKLGFLDGFHGLVFHVISSIYLFTQEIKTAEKMNILGENFISSLFKRTKSTKKRC